MLLPNNRTLQLNYDPATDVLLVVLPDILNFTLPEVEKDLQAVVEAITNYDIKKLLLDSSKAMIEVDDAAYKHVILNFGKELMKTRLNKLARIGSTLPTQEHRASEVADAMHKINPNAVLYKNFSNKAEALKWLVKP